MPHVAYQDEDGIGEVVGKFERCEYSPGEFTHARHLTVACWLLCTMPNQEALDRMRAALLRFTAHHGKQGYHETITRFWMRLIERFLRQQHANMTTVQRVNAALQSFPSKDLLFEYYTRERVMSEIARRKWIEPDLATIGGTAELHRP